MPLAKAASLSILYIFLNKYCHINSDTENIEQEDHGELLQARILQDILKC